MPERRYSRYKREEVINHAIDLQAQLHIQIEKDSFAGSTVIIKRLDTGKDHITVILARSSDWYHYSLNCFDHHVTAIIAGTHDSCINLPILALDTLRWYDPLKMRGDWGEIKPQVDKQGKLIPDRFDRHRRTQYGHNMLIGALMQRREDALARLATFQKSTRLRIEAEIKHLHKRRRGHPLKLLAIAN